MGTEQKTPSAPPEPCKPGVGEKAPPSREGKYLSSQKKKTYEEKTGKTNTWVVEENQTETGQKCGVGRKKRENRCPTGKTNPVELSSQNGIAKKGTRANKEPRVGHKKKRGRGGKQKYKVQRGVCSRGEVPSAIE